MFGVKKTSGLGALWPPETSFLRFCENGAQKTEGRVQSSYGMLCIKAPELRPPDGAQGTKQCQKRKETVSRSSWKLLRTRRTIEYDSGKYLRRWRRGMRRKARFPADSLQIPCRFPADWTGLPERSRRARARIS